MTVMQRHRSKLLADPTLDGQERLYHIPFTFNFGRGRIAYKSLEKWQFFNFDKFWRPRY